jgi:hypothetical protein
MQQSGYCTHGTLPIHMVLSLGFIGNQKNSSVTPSQHISGSRARPTHDSRFSIPMEGVRILVLLNPTGDDSFCDGSCSRGAIVEAGFCWSEPTICQWWAYINRRGETVSLLPNLGFLPIAGEQCTHAVAVGGACPRVPQLRSRSFIQMGPSLSGVEAKPLGGLLGMGLSPR